MRYLLFFLVGVVSAALALPDKPKVPEAALERLHKPREENLIVPQVVGPTVLISSVDSSASGVVLKVKGLVRILTAKHVADNVKDRTAVYSRAGRVETRRMAVVVVKAPEADLALLTPEDDKWLVPAFQSSVDPVPQPGEEAWYCGYGSLVPFNLVKTIVNQMAMHGELVVNGEGWKGHSGSGVFVKRAGKWVLAGIVVRPVASGSPHSPVGCVPWADIHTFLESVK